MLFRLAPHDCTRARRTTDAPEESGPAAMAQQAIYEQMVFPTRFVWAHGGKQVRPARIATLLLSERGFNQSPTRWLNCPADPPVPSSGSDIPPTPIPPRLAGAPVRLVHELAGDRPDGARAHLGAPVFAVVCNLPPGYHQYKFIVDGEWRHDENQAFIQDPLGNVNNWLFVKKPGSLNEAGHGATQQQGIPIPQHSPRRAQEARDARRGDPGGSRPSQNGEGAGMDWVDSMGQMQIKRDVDGVLKPAVSGMTSAMGVKGAAAPYRMV